MHRLATLVASLVLAFGLFAGFGSAAVVTAQDAGYAPDGEEAAFVELLNGYRGSLGLAPVSLNYSLGAAADYHSVDMATNNYFDHYLFDGTDPGTNIQNFGYTAFPIGENIAAGMGSAQEVMIAWQNSPEHNATMTNPAFTEVGVGRYYVEGSYYGWYWTATYGGGGGAPVAAPEELAVPVEDPALADPSLQAQAPETVTTVTEEPAVVTYDGYEGEAVELQQDVVNADGDRAVSTGANPVSDGTGDTVIYGDINTGGVMGESIVYEPPSMTVTGDGTAPAPAPAPVETVYTEPVYTEPVYTEPTYTEATYTEPTMSETTTTNISMEDGNGRAIG
jgi:uncharacterized protein YkwD